MSDVINFNINGDLDKVQLKLLLRTKNMKLIYLCIALCKITILKKDARSMPFIHIGCENGPLQAQYFIVKIKLINNEIVNNDKFIPWFR